MLTYSKRAAFFDALELRVSRRPDVLRAVRVARSKFLTYEPVATIAELAALVEQQVAHKEAAKIAKRTAAKWGAK